MNIISIVLSNGFVLLIPIFIFNIVFSKKLPAAYGAEEFDADIPKLLLYAENILRIVIFVIPVFIRLDFLSSAGKSGLAVYSAGVVIYFLSWLALILFPESSWCGSPAGFSAPAYTPLIWLFGMSLMFDSCYFGIPVYRWVYPVLSVIFTGIHLSHTILVYRKM